MLNNCKAIKEANEDILLNHKGVIGTGVGVKWINGAPTTEPAILVFVETKHSLHDISSGFASADVVPKDIDGIQTDVIEVGKIVKQNFVNRVRPLKPGYSVGHPQISAGTIGGFFLDNDNDHVILSNCHVLGWENKGKTGDLIYQPGVVDYNGNKDFRGWNDPVSSLPYFATLKKFIPIGSNNNVQDSSIALIHPKYVSEKLIDTIYPTINRPINNFGSAVVNMPVQKCGRTTGYTTGRVIGLHSSFTIDYDFGSARFNDCIVITSCSQGGDSGSLIFDMNMNAVGLLFAGSPKVTIANPISYVKDSYGLKLYNATPSPTPTPVPVQPPTPPTPTPPSPNIDNWSRSASNGTSIGIENGIIKIKAAANQYCCLERKISSFKIIQVKANTGSDKGATWGPSLTIVWPNGTMKVNLRYNGTFGGCINSKETNTIGSVKPNTEYLLRIRKISNAYVGEVNDGNWKTIIQVPINSFSGSPIIRIGKTNNHGQLSDYSVLGDIGECSFSDIQIN